MWTSPAMARMYFSSPQNSLGRDCASMSVFERARARELVFGLKLGFGFEEDMEGMCIGWPSG